MTVGDIGAGSGYNTVRLSRLVGPTGSVVAQDVTRDYLVEFAGRTERLKLTNVRFALGEPHDPHRPASSLDAAILVHMYHEIREPYAFLYNLAPTLKPGARVGIVDLERPTSEHGTPIELLRLAIARSPHISSPAMADTWRCSLHRSKRVEISPRYRCLCGSCRHSLITWRRSVPQQLLSQVSELKRDANKRRRNRPGCLDAGDEIAGDL
jgi:ubiquinone/menaquinone biosynthesis C-methylase UbiE